MAGSCWPIDLLPVDETMLACCTPWLAWCRRGERSGGGCGQRRHESERTCESSSPFWIDAQCGGRSKFEEDRLRHPWRPTAATSACVMRSINREMGSRSALVIRRDRAVRSRVAPGDRTLERPRTPPQALRVKRLGSAGHALAASRNRPAVSGAGRGCGERVPAGNAQATLARVMAAASKRRKPSDALDQQESWNDIPQRARPAPAIAGP